MVNTLTEKESGEALQIVTPCMTAVMLQSMLPRVTTFIKTSVEPELERRLGHKVTEYNWQCYYLGLEAKQRQQDWYNFLDSFFQSLIDRQIIYNFVLEGN